VKFTFTSLIPSETLPSETQKIHPVTYSNTIIQCLQWLR